MKQLTLWCLLGGWIGGFAQAHTISGYVQAESGKEALAGVAVYDSLSGKGTYSNVYGFFSLTLPANSIILRTKDVSFLPFRAAFDLNQDTTLRIDLSPKSLAEVEIVADSWEEPLKLGRVQIPVEQLKQVPAIFGEVDVLKALALVPGVSVGVEGTSGLLVRGGSTDQNLLLLDGAPVYNAAHLFGFLSVFNSDAISQVSLYKGNFPARYGGRLASVVDIRLREGDQQERKGKASVGLLASRVLYEGPLGENSSFLLSGRASYLGLFLLPVYLSWRQGGADTYFNYWLLDGNAKFNHRFKDGSQLFLSTYAGQDFWHVQNGDPRSGATRFGLQWGNQTGSLRYNRLLSDQVFMQTQLSFSRYQYQLSTSEEAPTIDTNPGEDQGLRSRSAVRDWSFSAQWEYAPVPAHGLKWGMSGIYHRFSPRTLSLFGELDSTFGSPAIPAIELGGFVEDNIRVLPGWEVNAGLRWSYFGGSDTSYQGWEPRLGTQLQLPRKFQLSFAYGRMNQYLHLLANNGAGLPNDIWVPPTDRIPPQQADQWSAGISQGIPQHGLEWSLEGYYKQMSGLIDYRQGIDFASSISTDWQQLVEINGEGVAYGAEAMIRKTRGKLTGWLGYTLSWNLRQFAGINAGIAYPGSFDRRHDISATASYQLNDFWQLAGNWVFQSGRPVTLPSAVYQLPNSEGLNGRNYVLVYQGRNQSRMPAYHRLDLSATWFPDGKDKAKSWSFGVYNAYNRQNPFYLDLQTRSGMDATGTLRVLGFSLTQQSLFPFLPWISHQWEF